MKIYASSSLARRLFLLFTRSLNSGTLPKGVETPIL